MSYTRDQTIAVHKDYQETVNNWEYYIRSYNGGYYYMIVQYLKRYNLEVDNVSSRRLARSPINIARWQRLRFYFKPWRCISFRPF